MYRLRTRRRVKTSPSPLYFCCRPGLRSSIGQPGPITFWPGFRALTALRVDPVAKPRTEQRVAVFIDGWNLHRSCERAFGHGQVHPLSLARHLAGDRQVARVGYFIGVPDQRVDKPNAQKRMRQLAVMEETGVRVVARKLKYRWEWKLDKRSLPHPAKHDGETIEAEAKSINQGREKGVDVALALDAFYAAQHPNIDVVIIVSADSDLDLISEQVKRLPDSIGARVENAVVNRHNKLVVNRAFAWSHQIDKVMFNAIRDDTDYGKKIPTPKRKKLIASVVDAK